MSLDDIKYTSDDVDAATGGYVNSGVLRSWASRGGLPADAAYARQQGVIAHYTRMEIVSLALMAELRAYGLAMPLVADMASRWLRAVTEDGKVWAVMIWSPREDGPTLADAKHLKAPLSWVFKEYGESAMVINVAKVIKRVDAVLAERHGG